MGSANMSETKFSHCIASCVCDFPHFAHGQGSGRNLKMLLQLLLIGREYCPAAVAMQIGDQYLPVIAQLLSQSGK